MANWSDLKAAVSSIIKTNGAQEITGQLLQNVLNNIISNVGANSTFAGIATPDTNPGTPDGNVFYLATTAGTYSNFNGIVINPGEAVILEWKGSWVKKDSGFATQEKISELGQYFNDYELNKIVKEIYIERDLSRFDFNKDFSITVSKGYPVIDGTGFYIGFNINQEGSDIFNAMFNPKNEEELMLVQQGIYQHNGLYAVVDWSNVNYKTKTYNVKINKKAIESLEFSPSISSYLSKNELKNDIKDVRSEVIETEQTLKNEVFTTGIRAAFDEDGYFDLYGNITNGGKNSGILNIYSHNIIQYAFYGNSSICGVKLLNSKKEFLQEISIFGVGGSAVRNAGIINLNEEKYKEVRYVAFSSFGTSPIPTGLIYSTNTLLNDTVILAEEIKRVDSKITPIITFYDFPNNYLVNLYGENERIQGGGYSTDFINIVGFTSIEAILELNSSYYVLSFYDKNKKFISGVKGTGGSATKVTYEVDLTIEDYKDAYYVVASTFNNPEGRGVYVKLENANYFGKDLIPTFADIANLKSYKFGLKYCALGDSITDGDGNASKSWYDMLLDRYNAHEGSLNFAETGQCLRTMADLCTAENMANIDICFIKGGTNQISNYNIGTIDDVATPDRWQPNTPYTVGDRVLGGTLEKHGWTTPIYAYLYWYECIEEGISGNTVDASGFPITTNTEFTDGTVKWKCVGSPSWWSDMKGICRRVWGFNPKIQIIWIIPIKTTSDIGKPVGSWSRASKYQAIRDFCEYNSIRYIDMQKEFPLNEWTKDSIMADSLHPNKNGYKIMMNIVDSHI